MEPCSRPFRVSSWGKAETQSGGWAAGKALRAIAGARGGVLTGLDLSAYGDVFAFAEDKPFTFALWVRSDEWDTLGSALSEWHVCGNGKDPILSVQPLQDRGRLLAFSERTQPGSIQQISFLMTKGTLEYPGTGPISHSRGMREEPSASESTAM